MKQTNEEKFLQVLADKVFQTECLVIEDRREIRKVPSLGISWGKNDGWISLVPSVVLPLYGNEIYFALSEVLPSNLIIKADSAPKSSLNRFLIESGGRTLGNFICSLRNIEDFVPSYSDQLTTLEGGCLLIRANQDLYIDIQGNYFNLKIIDENIILGEKVMETVKVDAVLGAISIPLDKLLSLRPGDKIELSNVSEIPVTLQIGSIPVAQAVLNNNQIEISRLYTKLSSNYSEQTI